MASTRVFDRLALPWPLSILFGAGMGLAFFFSAIKLPLWGFASIFLSLLPVIIIWGRSPLNNQSNWDHRDIYPSKTTWLYFIPVFLWIFAVPLLPETPATGILLGIVLFVFGALLARYSHRLAGATGRHRARAILAKDVTTGEEQIEAARQHRDVLSALYALGAVEGIRVRTRLVAYVLNTEAPATLREAREPQAAGLVCTSAVDAGDDAGKILMALTPEGVHALSRAAQSGPQRA